ncbi:polyprenyl synthetase family protein [Lachnoclostridium sp. MSJ-17]|uniref:polyprenyl synthetase family protein n=1 Tax=Lachnoclostridium sp. MSJ-17 TaxID=2841516 RepID=UPI001C1158FA|nr:farnesyl diphosphate synthase [Lachnoclostridium sp. MSJ-17]MBU5462074.1 polyprenyl synthetase family protein [Lachnoclostridium sp. MSJ-17]
MKNDYAKLTETELYGFLPSLNCRERVLIEAMKYSLEAGGKRVRPKLVFEFSRLCGGSDDAAAPFACAVEMVHTYSLIHDDLPCMDDDDLRRGKPSNHKVYGEDIALLAGDALLTLAFETISGDRAAVLAGDRACRLAAKTLASYAGANGMVGGQVIDLKSENTNAPLEVLREMDYKKTACLIKAACELGCIAANADDEQLEAASLYGECVGIAFQIQDDILDRTSTDAELGKPVGSDMENSKSTYVSLLGIERCRELVDELTKQALEALETFGADTAELRDFALSLAKRTN